jgi:hypothetical protein
VSWQTLVVTEAGDRVEIRLNRPEARNASNAVMIADQLGVCTALERRPRFLIITVGSEGLFAAGRRAPSSWPRRGAEALGGPTIGLLDPLARRVRWSRTARSTASRTSPSVPDQDERGTGMPTAHDAAEAADVGDELLPAVSAQDSGAVGVPAVRPCPWSLAWTAWRRSTSALASRAQRRASSPMPRPIWITARARFDGSHPNTNTRAPSPASNVNVRGSISVQKSARRYPPSPAQ